MKSSKRLLSLLLACFLALSLLPTAAFASSWTIPDAPHFYATVTLAPGVADMYPNEADEDVAYGWAAGAGMYMDDSGNPINDLMPGDAFTVSVKSSVGFVSAWVYFTFDSTYVELTNADGTGLVGDDVWQRVSDDEATQRWSAHIMFSDEYETPGTTIGVPFEFEARLPEGFDENNLPVEVPFGFYNDENLDVQEPDKISDIPMHWAGTQVRLIGDTVTAAPHLYATVTPDGCADRIDDPNDVDDSGNQVNDLVVGDAIHVDVMAGRECPALWVRVRFDSAYLDLTDRAELARDGWVRAAADDGDTTEYWFLDLSARDCGADEAITCGFDFTLRLPDGFDTSALPIDVPFEFDMSRDMHIATPEGGAVPVDSNVRCANTRVRLIADAASDVPLALSGSYDRATRTAAVSVVATEPITLSNYDAALLWDERLFTPDDIVNGQEERIGNFFPNVAVGKISAASDGDNVTIEAGETLATFFLTAAYDLEPGYYSFALTVRDASDENGDALAWKGYTVDGLLDVSALSAENFDCRAPEGVTVEYESPAAGDFTVASEKPCIVLYNDGNGYQALEASAVDDGTYSFTLPEGFSGSEEIIVAVKGDFTGDGEVSSTDALQVLRCAAGNREFDEASALICDVNGDGELTSTDALQLLRVSAELRTLDW